MLITSCCLFLQYSFFYSFRAIINILDEKSVFWIVLAGQEWEDWKDEPYVQQRFFFPTMTKPLRSTKSIIQFVQKEEPSPDEKVWTCYPCVMPTALDYSDMPDNLLEGAGTDVFKVRTQLTIPETIASAFNSFPEDERILLISDRRTYQVVSVIEKLALENKPKLIIAGGSAYSRVIDFKRVKDDNKEQGVTFSIKGSPNVVDWKLESEIINKEYKERPKRNWDGSLMSNDSLETRKVMISIELEKDFENTCKKMKKFSKSQTYSFSKTYSPCCGKRGNKSQLPPPSPPS